MRYQYVGVTAVRCSVCLGERRTKPAKLLRFANQLDQKSGQIIGDTNDSFHCTMLEIQPSCDLLP
jgi:hypothetical protein